MTFFSERNSCSQGENITLPNKTLTFAGLEFVNNCERLVSASSLFAENSPECSQIQAIGTLCGCSKPKNACDLCNDGSRVMYPSRELSMLASTYNGITPTCEVLESTLHRINETDTDCDGARWLVGEYCGCGAVPGTDPPFIDDKDRCNLCYHDEPVPFPDKKIGIIDFPFETCGELAEATAALFIYDPILLNDWDRVEEIMDDECYIMRQLSVHCGCVPRYQDPCPICRAHEHAPESYETPRPDQLVDPYLTEVFYPGVQLTCGAVADIALTGSLSIPDHFTLCGGIQAIGVHCGCTPPDPAGACSVCSTPLSEESRAHHVGFSAPLDVVSCGLVELMGDLFDNGNGMVEHGVEQAGFTADAICNLYQYAGYLCGCNGSVFTYWGADTLPKQKAGIWIQRVTAILSLVGSFAIIFDIVKLQKFRTSMYHQIMLCLSLCDSISSLAWGLGPLPTANVIESLGIEIYPYIPDDSILGFYGSHGTDATCKVQGFMLHLGFTSILYNAALSFYFKLSSINGWTESSFTLRYRIIFLVFPAIVGIALAFAALPFITFTPIACSMGSYSDQGGWLKVKLLFFLPYGPAFLITPFNTISIYRKVRVQGERSRRWRFSAAGRQLAADAAVVVLEGSTVLETASRLDGSSENTAISRLSRFSKRGRDRRKGLKRKSSTLTRQVFWKSVHYVVAFYLTYSVYTVTFMLDGYKLDSYWFYIILAIFTPMQGFFNLIIYFRTRFAKRVVRRSRQVESVSHSSFLSKIWQWRRSATSSTIPADKNVSNRSA